MLALRRHYAEPAMRRVEENDRLAPGTLAFSWGASSASRPGSQFRFSFRSVRLRGASVDLDSHRTTHLNATQNATHDHLQRTPRTFATIVNARHGRPRFHCNTRRPDAGTSTRDATNSTDATDAPDATDLDATDATELNATD